MLPFKHNNGDKAKSNISGFAGMITARAEHIYGCNRYLVAPGLNREGDPRDGYWFDEDELIITEPVKVLKLAKNTGGPASKLK